MEWVGLVTWAIALALALPIAGGAVVAPSLGLHPLLVGGGAVACVLYIVLDGGRWLAWTSFGLALVAAMALGVAVRALTSDESQASGAVEFASGPAGFQVTLLPAIAFFMLLAATGVTTIG